MKYTSHDRYTNNMVYVGIIGIMQWGMLLIGITTKRYASHRYNDKEVYLSWYVYQQYGIPIIVIIQWGMLIGITTMRYNSRRRYWWLRTYLPISRNRTKAFNVYSIYLFQLDLCDWLSIVLWQFRGCCLLTKTSHKQKWTLWRKLLSSSPCNIRNILT